MHFLEIDKLKESQLNEIFNLTDKLKSNANNEYLRGKTFILFFPETSIRTRITFEKAVTDLGGKTILFPPETINKREKLEDVIKYISNWADGVIIRHRDFDKVVELSKHSSIPIINAMTSKNHPCEIASDLYAISKIRRNYKNLVYTFVGGLGNILYSWAKIAEVMDLQFNHVCELGNRLKEDDSNYKFHTNLEEVLKVSDVVLTDPLPEELKTDEYISKYQVSLDRMKLTKDNSILNPCPPFFRNEEVSEDVIKSQYFVGHEFKKDLLYVQQAIILYCCGIRNI